MHIAASRFFIAFLFLSVVCTGETGRNYDHFVIIKFSEVSPDRNIPIVANVPHALEILERGAAFGVHANGIQPRLKAIDGWQADCRRNWHVRSFDDYELLIETNEPARLHREVKTIFQTLGFLPVDPFTGHDNPGKTSVAIMFFDDITFVYGGPLPAIVLRRPTSDSSYQFVGKAAITTGRILERSFGSQRLFYFKEDHTAVLQHMRREYPTAKVLALWNGSGELVLEVDYDYLEWGTHTLKVHRNTEVFAASGGVGSSSLMCPTSGSQFQLSLLDPLRKEPAVLTMTLVISYAGPKLRPISIDLGIEPVAYSNVGGIVCRKFQTVDGILAAQDFGVCGRNLGGVTNWRCLGNARDYLKESWEYSLRYWLGLYSYLNENSFSVPVTVDPTLRQGIEKLWKTCDDCPVDPRNTPHGLGYPQPFGLLRVVAVNMK